MNTENGGHEMAWAALMAHKVNKIVFHCQRCGNCCRHFISDEKCPQFQEPNVCLIYNERPQFCRDYPVYDGSGQIKICPVSQQAFKTWRKLRAGIVQPWDNYKPGDKPIVVIDA
jgi:Fe-S-cluster containining protein